MESPKAIFAFAARAKSSRLVQVVSFMHSFVSPCDGPVHIYHSCGLKAIGRRTVLEVNARCFTLCYVCTFSKVCLQMVKSVVNNRLPSWGRVHHQRAYLGAKLTQRGPFDPISTGFIEQRLSPFSSWYSSGSWCGVFKIHQGPQLWNLSATLCMGHLALVSRCSGCTLSSLSSTRLHTVQPFGFLCLFYWDFLGVKCLRGMSGKVGHPHR